MQWEAENYLPRFIVVVWKWTHNISWVFPYSASVTVAECNFKYFQVNSQQIINMIAPGEVVLF